MRSFLICLVLSVASAAPSGVEHGGGGPSTVAPFAGAHIGGFYGHGSGSSGPLTSFGSSHNSGFHGQSGNLQTIATFTGGHGGYGGGHGGQGGYGGGHGGQGGYGGGNGGYGYGNAGLSSISSSFGSSHGSLGGGGFNGGSYGGLSNGHLTAGAINGGGYGGFNGASIDGHISAGSGGNFGGGFNGGLDGHLTAGAGISTAGPGSISGPIEGPTAGPVLPVEGPIGGGGGFGHGAIEGGPLVTKDFFFHSAAEDYDEGIVAKTLNLGPSRKHYRVVFIKAPSQSSKATALQILQAQNEEKTVIYVLSKKNDASEIHTEIQAQKNSHAKPEVYFIKYKTPEEAIHAQKQIQAQYDSLGGVSRFSDEGVSPVTSIIGSLGQNGPEGVGGQGLIEEGHGGGFSGAGQDNFGGGFIHESGSSSASSAAFAGGAIHSSHDAKIIGGGSALGIDGHGHGSDYLPSKH